MKLEARLIAVLADGEFTVGSISGLGSVLALVGELRTQALEDLEVAREDPLARAVAEGEVQRFTGIAAALLAYLEAGAVPPLTIVQPAGDPDHVPAS